MTHATRPVAFVLCALMLCALMLSIAPTAAQKITIDEVMKPYDATTRAEPVPPSSGQMDRQLVVPVRGVLGVLGVLIIGSAIYWFRRRSAQRWQGAIPLDQKDPVPLDLFPLRAVPAEPIDS